MLDSSYKAGLSFRAFSLGVSCFVAEMMVMVMVMMMMMMMMMMMGILGCIAVAMGATCARKIERCDAFFYSSKIITHSVVGTHAYDRCFERTMQP